MIDKMHDSIISLAIWFHFAASAMAGKWPSNECDNVSEGGVSRAQQQQRRRQGRQTNNLCCGVPRIHFWGIDLTKFHSDQSYRIRKNVVMQAYYTYVINGTFACLQAHIDILLN